VEGLLWGGGLKVGRIEGSFALLVNCLDEEDWR
jgi:hypothetical protein